MSNELELTEILNRFDTSLSSLRNSYLGRLETIDLFDNSPISLVTPPETSLLRLGYDTKLIRGKTSIDFTSATATGNESVRNYSSRRPYSPRHDLKNHMSPHDQYGLDPVSPSSPPASLSGSNTTAPSPTPTQVSSGSNPLPGYVQSQWIVSSMDHIFSGQNQTKSEVQVHNQHFNLGNGTNPNNGSEQVECDDASSAYHSFSRNSKSNSTSAVISVDFEETSASDEGVNNDDENTEKPMEIDPQMQSSASNETVTHMVATVMPEPSSRNPPTSSVNENSGADAIAEEEVVVITTEDEPDIEDISKPSPASQKVREVYHSFRRSFMSKRPSMSALLSVTTKEQQQVQTTASPSVSSPSAFKVTSPTPSTTSAIKSFLAKFKFRGRGKNGGYVVPAVFKDPLQQSLENEDNVPVNEAVDGTTRGGSYRYLRRFSSSIETATARGGYATEELDTPVVGTKRRSFSVGRASFSFLHSSSRVNNVEDSQERSLRPRMSLQAVRDAGWRVVKKGLKGRHAGAEGVDGSYGMGLGGEVEEDKWYFLRKLRENRDV
jgi:hypothetical protein